MPWASQPQLVGIFLSACSGVYLDYWSWFLQTNQCWRSSHACLHTQTLDESEVNNSMPLHSSHLVSSGTTRRPYFDGADPKKDAADDA